MIAALPMYDRPELAGAHDAFWEAIRARLGYGPTTLSRGGDLWEIWRDPSLVLAQTCGLPFRAQLHGHVTLVATPDYALRDCPPGYYRSVFVARRGAGLHRLSELDGARLAFNDGLSQSGWAAPMAALENAGVTPGALLETGAHRASARAVAEGLADAAALDARSWEIIRAHDPFAAELEVFDDTPPTPGLPLITASGRDPAPLFDAVCAAIRDLSAEDRAALGLRGLVRIPVDAYLAQPIPAPPPPDTPRLADLPAK